MNYIDSSFTYINDLILTHSCHIDSYLIMQQENILYQRTDFKQVYF